MTNYDAKTLKKTNELAKNASFTSNDTPTKLDEQLYINGTRATHYKHQGPRGDDITYYHKNDDTLQEITTVTWNDYKKAEHPSLEYNYNTCPVCNEPYHWKNQTHGLCPDCGESTPRKLAHPWSIIIPQNTGIVFNIQCGGMACNHAYIEGVNINLDTPTLRVDTHDDLPDCIDPIHEPDRKNWFDGYDNIDLGRLLRRENYPGNLHDTPPINTNDLWTLINEQLPFDYTKKDRPNDQHPRSTQGLTWINITDANTQHPSINPWQQLIGETVALNYPNCD